MLPPFPGVSFVEGPAPRAEVRPRSWSAAVYAVEARDAEIARLRAHIATLEAARRVSTATVENPAATPLGLWTIHGDRPARMCTIAPWRPVAGPASGRSGVRRGPSGNRRSAGTWLSFTSRSSSCRP